METVTVDTAQLTEVEVYILQTLHVKNGLNKRRTPAGISNRLNHTIHPDAVKSILRKLAKQGFVYESTREADTWMITKPAGEHALEEAEQALAETLVQQMTSLKAHT